MEDNFKSAYVSVNNVPTNILTWGRWIEESLDDVKEIVLCITGNPGLPGFYTEFAATINKNLESNIPVWVIGHAGQDEPSKGSLHKVPSIEGNENLYNLEGQVQHKIDFIEKYIPKTVKIHFIGHSIGAWMVLELLKLDAIKNRTQKCYLLFPTIERMAVSQNGKMFMRSCYFHSIYFLFLKLLYFLPPIVRLLILRVYFWLFSIPLCYIKPALKYSKPSASEKVIFLAKDEMATVKALDVEHIKKVKYLLKLYYGASDGWVPASYFKEIKEKIPDLDAELCNKNISHSFVLHLQHSVEMANMISEWIQENKC